MPDRQSRTRTVEVLFAIEDPQGLRHGDLVEWMLEETVPESGAIGSLLSAASGTWALVPGLHLPLFNRGRLKSRVKASQAVLEGEQIRFEQAYLLALEEVEGALVRYSNRQGEVHRLQIASQASAESVRLARILYQRGLTDYLTVLDAERSLNEIEFRLATLRTRLTLDAIALYKALGGGWEVHG